MNEVKNESGPAGSGAASTLHYEVPGSDTPRTNLALRGLLETGSRLIALVVIFVGFGLFVPGGAFFRAGNIENILIQSAVYAMAAIGMTIIIITGGIDLAAGSNIAFAMVVTALTLNAGEGAKLAAHPLLWTCLAVFLGVTAATLVGLLQGVLITGLRLVPFIITLGGFQWVRGMTKGIANNQEITPPASNWLFQNLMSRVQGRQFNWQLVSLGVWLTLLAAIAATAMLRYTKLGRRIYAIGSNEATARLCGVPVQRTKVYVYAIAGFFAGLAGVLEFSKLNMGQPTGAATYELYVIAACVIGGASLMGGVGTISGSVIGALIIGTLNAGLGQVDLPKWVQEVAIGVIIIAAVALDQLRNWKRD